jgi:hypothetical protein
MSLELLVDGINLLLFLIKNVDWSVMVMTILGTDANLMEFEIFFVFKKFIKFILFRVLFILLTVLMNFSLKLNQLLKLFNFVFIPFWRLIFASKASVDC